jgi:hypothetical protein
LERRRSGRSGRGRRQTKMWVEEQLGQSEKEFVEEFSGRICYGLAGIHGGYDQFELAEEHRDLTAFQTPIGLKRLTRLPQGATNSVAAYQQAMLYVMVEEVPENMNIFIDDNGIKGPRNAHNEEVIEENPAIRRWVWEYAVTLERILFHLEVSGLAVSGPKFAVIVPSLEILGMVVSKEGKRVVKTKLNKIECLPTPGNVNEVRSALGMFSYVRQWIPKFADLAKPLRDLTRKEAEWEWTEAHQASFEELKKRVGRDILLAKIDYSPAGGRIIV